MKIPSVRSAAPIAILACAVGTSMCSQSSPASPSSMAATSNAAPSSGNAGTFAAGDTTNSTPTAGQVKVCKAGNVSGTFTVSWSPISGGSASVSSPITVSTGTCRVVAEDSDAVTGVGSNITVTETSSGLQSISASDLNGPVPFSNGGSVFLNSFHGWTITFTNQVSTPPPTTALFVIGDVEPHGVGDVVNFWGAQWWKNNVMSGFVSNGYESFKGYATQSDNVCGGKWISSPGNSSDPPDTIPDVITIIVTDTVVKNGNDISGNIKQLVTVAQDGGYGPAPGQRGNGPVVTFVCGK
jgi:hypothetical protein